MLRTPTSIPDLISRWETISAYAADVGCGYEAARQQRRRGSIAPKHWESVVVAASKHGVPGVTLEWLARQRHPTQESNEQ